MPLGKKISFLGSGNMAEALVKGLLASGAASASELVCAEPRDERRREIAARYGVKALASNREAVAAADVVLLSVKPQLVDAVLDEIAADVGGAKLLVSIAAGVPIARLAGRLPAGARIVRTMRTPAPSFPAMAAIGTPAAIETTSFRWSMAGAISSRRTSIVCGFTDSSTISACSAAATLSAVTATP